MLSSSSLEVKTHNASIALEPVEKRYDSDSNRLYLVYYALPEGLNANKWGVSSKSLPVNIKTAINKPVIIYPKNHSNPFHANQAGNFAHPTTEEAARELGHPINPDEYFKWQEKFAVGRIVNVEEDKDNGGGGYAWTLEITDPNVKTIMKSDSFDTLSNRPAWTSPQILTYPQVYPDEDRTGIYDHWVVSHVILTDQPAYGFDKAALVSKCLGKEQECLSLIKTKSASTSSTTSNNDDDLDEYRKSRLMFKGMISELKELEESNPYKNPMLNPNSRESVAYRVNMAAKAELERQSRIEVERKKQEAAAMTRKLSMSERIFGSKEEPELMNALSDNPYFYPNPNPRDKNRDRDKDKAE